MKKLTIVLSLLAFLASTLIAQNDIPRFSKMGPQIIKHDTFSEQYLTSEREHKFNYYDETEIEDINMSVNLYSDNSFRLDSILGYDYYSISNGLDWKKEYTYDSNGNLTLWIYSIWNADLNDWEVYQKFEYTYDSNGNQTLDIESFWNADLNDWGLREKYEYTYDSNGNLTLRVDYAWNTAVNDWDNTWKEEVTYDANGNRTLDIESIWNTDLNDWEVHWKYEYNYDSNGNLTLVISSIWNTGGNWDFYYRNEYNYDSNGNQTLWIWSIWDTDLNDWGLRKKDEYTYASIGNQTLVIVIESIWDTDLNDWGLRKKYEYTFDSNGNLTLDKESWWDTDLNDWEVHWKSEYYWSIPSEVGELNINDIFTVFPNPTSGNLSIKGEVFLNQHVILEMTNLRGQSVYSNKLFLTNIDHNIILPKLPKGMYLLTIKANSINSTQKIFIE